VQNVQKYNECDFRVLQSSNAAKTSEKKPVVPFSNPPDAQFRTDSVVIVLQK